MSTFEEVIQAKDEILNELEDYHVFKKLSTKDKVKYNSRLRSILEQNKMRLKDLMSIELEEEPRLKLEEVVINSDGTYYLPASRTYIVDSRNR